MENYKYTTYLIGSMQVAGESTTDARDKIEEELLDRNVYPINPTKMESGKTGMTAKELGKKMKGWIASGSWDQYKEYSDYIWKGKTIENEQGSLVYVPGDFHYVEIADFIIAFFNEGDRGCGTYAEAGYSYKLNKPVYLVTNVAKRDLLHSFLCFIVGSEGEVFYSKNQLLDFLDKKYKLKKKRKE